MSEYVIFIHSVVWLTTRPYPLPNRVRHRVRSGVSSVNFQYPVFSLRSCSNFLRHLSRLPVTSLLSSIFPSVTCFWRQFLCKMRPIHLGLLPFIVCRIFLSSSTLCLILHFLHDRSNWSSSSFSSIMFQNIRGIYDLFSEVSKFQHHTKLCSNIALYYVFLFKFKPSLLVNRIPPPPFFLRLLLT